MKAAPIPDDEAARLAALDELAVLDTAPEPEFDEIARVAARVAEAPIALVSLIDRDRQWFKARCGLDVRETPRAVSFCGHAILETKPFIIQDTLEDERFRDNPLVTAEPRIRFYAGFPIQSLGQPLGTLCVIDRVPRTLTDRQLRLLEALARQVEVQLEFRRREVAASAEPDPTTGRTQVTRQADSIPFRIRLYPAVRVEHLGGGFERLTGYRPEEFYDTETGARLVHPDDRPLLSLALRAPTTFRRPLTLRWQIKDGRWLWLVHHFKVRIEDGRPVALEGMAHPASTSEGRAGRTAITTELTAHALDAMAIVDAEGTIRYQSPAVTDVFGYQPAELAGRNAFELVHPEDQSELLAEVERMLAEPGSTSRRRYRYRHKDGSWKTVESVARNLTDDPAVRGILVQTRDMSKWAEMERSLAEAQEGAQRIAESRRLLVEDLRRLQEANQQLTALIVHDLNSPLTAVIGNAHFILEDARAAGMDVEPVQEIIRAGDVLQRMVMDILDVSRSETGQLAPKLSKVVVSDLVERACDGAAGVLRGRQQELSREMLLSQPEMAIELDSSLINRVLQNLLDNSSKYSPTGTRLTVRLSDSHRHVRIDVLDQGPGVPDDYKQKVFQLYARVDRDAAKHARTSRGLGLAFCKLAVDAHQGRIWVEDRAEGGSAFCIELPRR